MEWLKKKNKKAYKGWKSSDPMVCPGGKDSISDTLYTLVSTTKGLKTGTRAFTTPTITSSKLPTATSVTTSATFPTTGAK
ncbi:hypothetical protein TNCV_190441 [Trichonephila clavipes]|nr:hypothetical protein TNCV_190441 [Trichonephila clavipes]